LGLAYSKFILKMYLFTEISENPESVSLPGFVEQEFKLYYGLSDEGKAICNRLVSVVGFAHPAITYCPVLLPVASLLLHYVPVIMRIFSLKKCTRYVFVCVQNFYEHF